MEKQVRFLKFIRLFLVCFLSGMAPVVNACGGPKLILAEVKSWASGIGGKHGKIYEVHVSVAKKEIAIFPSFCLPQVGQFYLLNPISQIEFFMDSVIDSKSKIYRIKVQTFYTEADKTETYLGSDTTPCHPNRKEEANLICELNGKQKMLRIQQFERKATLNQSNRIN